MSNWFRKNEKIIAIVIVGLFVAGIIWWSVASYLSSGKGASQTQQKLTKEDSAFVMSINGEELGENYWVLQQEFNEIYSSQLNLYSQYGQQIDPAFDSVIIKANLVDQLLDTQIIKYYGEQNNLVPDNKELETILKNEVDSYINSLKSDKDLWAQLTEHYGGEKAIKSIVEDSFKQDILFNETYKRVTNLVAPVSREDVLAHATENFENLQSENNQVKASHILVEEEDLAIEILEKLKNNEITFTDAAAKHSLDTSNANSSGELGWFGKGEMVAEFEEAAFNAIIGEVTSPVKTSFGYHLILVEDKKEFKEPSDVFLFSEINDEITNTLKSEKFQTWLNSYKNENNFGKVFYDELLELSYVVNANSENLEKMKEIESELVNIIFDNGEIAYIENTYLTLYALATKNIVTDYNTKKTDYETYTKLSQTVPSYLLEKTLFVLEEEVAELRNKIDPDNYDYDLYEKIYDYEDAIELKILEIDLAERGLTDLEVLKVDLDKLKSEIDFININREKVLAELFYEFPSSSRVVTEYYQLNPNNDRVKLQYSKIMFNELNMYINYMGYQQVAMYFQGQFIEIMQNIEEVVSNKDAGENLRLEAADFGLDFAEAIGDFNMKLHYLEIIKSIDPNYYKDIDILIEETEQLLIALQTDSE